MQEPDGGFNPFQLAPRLLMNTADVAATHAVQPGSRVTWRYKFGGTPAQLAAYEKWLLPQLKPEHRWYGLEQDEGALGKSLERSQQFLLLSALLTLLLAVAAVAVAMGHYCRSRYDLVAILKTLGAGRAQLRKLIVGQWLMLLVLSALTGGIMGLLFEKLLMVMLKPVLPAALPPASLWPWLWALGAMTVISVLVGLRPYRLLLATQPLRVLRNDVVANVWPLKFYLPVIIAVAAGLLAWLMGGSTLLWAVLAGAVVLALLCGVLLLLAQVQVGMRQRHQELVVYRTLGAGKRLLRMTLWSEFALLGLVAGLVAAIGAETALAVLQTKVFDFPWEPDWRLWLTLPLCGAALLSLCGGWLGTRLLKGKALFRQFAS